MDGYVGKLPTVNPLDLPYFMWATIGKQLTSILAYIYAFLTDPSVEKDSKYVSVMSFGLIFLVIAVTWLKLIWEKEERLGIRR